MKPRPRVIIPIAILVGVEVRRRPESRRVHSFEKSGPSATISSGLIAWNCAAGST
jgi:hypothetical protein